MPRPKDSLALYELLTRHPPQGRPPTRSRWRTKRASDQAGESRKRPEPRSDAGTAPRRAKPRRASGPTPPTVLLSRLARNPARLSAAIGALAILLFAGYLVGKRWSVATTPVGAAAAAEGLDWARRQPPQPEVLKLFADQGATRAGAAADSRPAGTRLGRGGANKPTRIPVAEGGRVARRQGLNYIVVESFAPDRIDDARAAQEFLARHAINTTIEPSRKGWVVVTVEGFEARDPARRRMVKRIEQLGQAFFEQGGRYKFLCYAKLYQGQPW